LATPAKFTLRRGIFYHSQYSELVSSPPCSPA